MCNKLSFSIPSLLLKLTRTWEPRRGCVNVQSRFGDLPYLPRTGPRVNCWSAVTLCYDNLCEATVFQSSNTDNRIHSSLLVEQQFRIDIAMSHHMQDNVDFGLQIYIYSRIDENDGKPQSNWPVARRFGCTLTASKHKYMRRKYSLFPLERLVGECCVAKQLPFIAVIEWNT